MKKNFLFVSLLFAFKIGFAQPQHEIDSLKHELAFAGNDTSRMLIQEGLCSYYSDYNFDSADLYGKRSLVLAEKSNALKEQALILCDLSWAYSNNGDVPRALELGFKAFRIAGENNYQLEKAKSLNLIAAIYGAFDIPKQRSYLKQAKQIFEANQNETGGDWVYEKIYNDFIIGHSFLYNNQLDSSLIYLQKTYNTTPPNNYWHKVLMMALGEVYVRSGEYEKGLAYTRKSLKLCQIENDPYTEVHCYTNIALFYKEIKEQDSCIYYAKKGLETAQRINEKGGILNTSSLLSEQYETKDIEKALFYRKIADSINNEFTGVKTIQKLQKTIANEQERQRQAESDQIAYQNRLRLTLFLAGLVMMLVVASLLYRNNRQKQKANNLLSQEKEKVESTLEELKSTQSQLIQSEKMASLGELTAGIAHEIQNPLNFVNNFSEVNKEMLIELNEEIDKGNYDDAKSIAKGVIANEEKINHHGKRADAIVKGAATFKRKHRKKGTNRYQRFSR